MSLTRTPSSAVGLAVSLCRGDTAALRQLLEHPSWRPVGLCLVVLVLGAAAFGGALGTWRSPLQALYGATKVPLLFLLTALGTGSLNAMLAKLQGVPLTARQSVLAVLLSFALMAIVLGSLAPPVVFLAWSLPGVDSASAADTHRVILLVSVALIACAGVIANLRLLDLLKVVEVAPGQARRTLFAWLTANLFLGAQLSWNLRPFFGTPGLAVRFLRDDPFAGTFYESVFTSIRTLLLER